MGQQEIVDLLRKYQDKWFSSNEIADALLVSKGCVNRCLCRMRKRSEIKEKRERVRMRSGVGFHFRRVSFYSFKKG